MTTTDVTAAVRHIVDTWSAPMSNLDTGIHTTAIPSAYLFEVVEYVVAQTRKQLASEASAMDAEYLPSPGLDLAWVAGWRSATRHVAHRIASGGVR